MKPLNLTSILLQIHRHLVSDSYNKRSSPLQLCRALNWAGKIGTDEILRTLVLSAKVGQSSA
jgi:hypothetical protein